MFLRNASDCELTVACQQLRLRDCLRCTLFSCVLTPPSIESSRAIVLGCFHASYSALPAHFLSAGLSPLNNLWYRGYDFSEQALPPSGRPTNWALAEPERMARLRLDADGLAALDFRLGAAHSAVPVPTPQSNGGAGASNVEHAFVAFFAQHESVAVAFAQAIARTFDGSIALRQTWRAQLGEADVRRIWRDVLPLCSVLVAAARDSLVTGFHYCGADAVRHVNITLDAELARQPREAAPRSRFVAYASPSSKHAEAEAGAFFALESGGSAQDAWRGQAVGAVVAAGVQAKPA